MELARGRQAEVGPGSNRVRLTPAPGSPRRLAQPWASLSPEQGTQALACTPGPVQQQGAPHATNHPHHTQPGSGRTPARPAGGRRPWSWPWPGLTIGSAQALALNGPNQDGRADPRADPRPRRTPGRWPDRSPARRPPQGPGARPRAGRTPPHPPVPGPTATPKRAGRDGPARRPVLSGPVVSRRSHARRGEWASCRTPRRPRAMGSRVVPASVFRRALAELMAPRCAGRARRLSAEQRERIEAHLRHFQQAMRRATGAPAARDAGRDRSPASVRSDRAQRPAAAGRACHARTPIARREATAPHVCERGPRGLPGERPAREGRATADRPMTDRPGPGQPGARRPAPDRAAGDGPADRPRPPMARPDQGDRPAMARALVELQQRVWAELSDAPAGPHGPGDRRLARADGPAPPAAASKERYRREFGQRFEQMGRPGQARAARPGAGRACYRCRRSARPRTPSGSAWSDAPTNARGRHGMPRACPTSAAKPFGGGL
ncbi:MAG: hypothetical protein KatS3mg103_0330 [Phycisphaerales bacterium]|nr:MAG: hypothetical protein KatS3mg103_0330 [Phycisphaerales bacterium]